MARMKIFNTLEEAAFESPPEFNSGERKRFFSLSLLLKESQASLRTPTNKVCFLVAAGYFKARRKFFARQFRGLPATDQKRDRMLELPLSLTRSCRRKEREAPRGTDRSHSPRLGCDLAAF